MLFFDISHRQRGTTMWGTVSCWRCCWCSRSDDTGWKVRSILLWFGLTTKTILSSLWIKLTPGLVGAISCQTQLFPNLSTWFLEHQAQCPLPSIGSGTEETILPSAVVVGAARWKVEQEVQEALQNHPIPSECPASRLFVVPDVWSSSPFRRPS